MRGYALIFGITVSLLVIGGLICWRRFLPRWRWFLGLPLVIAFFFGWFWTFSPYAPFPRFIGVAAVNRLSDRMGGTYSSLRGWDPLGWLSFLHRSTWSSDARVSKWLMVARVGRPGNIGVAVTTGPKTFVVAYRLPQISPNLSPGYWITKVVSYGQGWQGISGASASRLSASPCLNGQWVQAVPNAEWGTGGPASPYWLTVEPVIGQAYPFQTGERILISVKVMSNPVFKRYLQPYTIYLMPQTNWLGVGRDQTICDCFKKYGAKLGQADPRKPDSTLAWVIPRAVRTGTGTLRLKPGQDYSLWAVAADGTYCATDLGISHPYSLSVKPSVLATGRAVTISGSGLSGQRFRIMLVVPQGEVSLGAVSSKHDAFQFQWSVPAEDQRATSGPGSYEVIVVNDDTHESWYIPLAWTSNNAGPMGLGTDVG